MAVRGYRQFVRKVFNDRAKALPEQSPERESFETDVDADPGISREQGQHRRAWPGDLRVHRLGSVRGDSAGNAVRRTLVVHRLGPASLSARRLVENYPRYAAVMLDTNKARIFVFGLAAAEREEKIVGEKTRRTSKGGWSQARYQRRADNFHMLTSRKSSTRSTRSSARGHQAHRGRRRRRGDANPARALPRHSPTRSSRSAPEAARAAFSRGRWRRCVRRTPRPTPKRSRRRWMPGRAAASAWPGPRRRCGVPARPGRRADHHRLARHAEAGAEAARGRRAWRRAGRHLQSAGAREERLKLSETRSRAPNRPPPASASSKTPRCCRYRRGRRIAKVPHMSRQNKVNPGKYTQRGV